ncbi:hypothetical protein VKT23_018491 [Stygiomarasmius scandens]|uniref:Uncharacterized protein n=1 Tax=Marasmiellus scandens TaxID=2682957 RepID=A0ABR1ITA3_9AGAR
MSSKFWTEINESAKRTGMTQGLSINKIEDNCCRLPAASDDVESDSEFGVAQSLSTADAQSTVSRSRSLDIPPAAIKPYNSSRPSESTLTAIEEEPKREGPKVKTRPIIASTDDSPSGSRTISQGQPSSSHPSSIS